LFSRLLREPSPLLRGVVVLALFAACSALLRSRDARAADTTTGSAATANDRNGLTRGLGLVLGRRRLSASSASASSSSLRAR
jgi:hypothetical protein